MNKKNIPNYILIAFVAYMAYDAYSFFLDDTSALKQADTNFQKLTTDFETKTKKLKDANEFFRTLEAKKAEIRSMSQQLATMKSTLTESLDIPAFMKLLVEEAKKIGITITSLTPEKQNKAEFYTEQPFSVNFQGVYVQLIAFLDRLSQAQSIVRVDEFSIHPKGSNQKGMKYIELDGVMKVKTYVYLGTKEDKIVENPGSVPATPEKPKKPGGGA